MRSSPSRFPIRFGIHKTTREMLVLAEILFACDAAQDHHLIVEQLTRHGHKCQVAHSVRDVKPLLTRHAVDLVIVDWLFPEGSGLILIEQMREGGLAELPILLLLAKLDVNDTIAGLDSGADDCLARPFEVSVLMARIHALLRRARAKHQKPLELDSKFEVYRVGPLELSVEAFEARCDGEKLDLTLSEFRILALFMGNPGKAFSRDRLTAEVRGPGANPSGRSIDTFIFVLRKKLGRHGERIETVRGLGYRLAF